MTDEVVTIIEQPAIVVTVPLGAKGDKGDTGNTGAGVPVGGTTGQVLIKASGANYDTAWSAAGAATWGGITGTLSAQTDLQAALDAKQATLVSGTNIKTLNGSTILGSGDLVISASAAWGGITGTLSSQTDLQTALDGKATAAQGALAGTALQPGAQIPWADVTGKPSFATVATSGAYADLTGKPTLFSGVYGDLTGIPATFAPSAHTHVIADVTGLQTALDGKQPLATVLTNTTASFTTAQETKLSGIATGATVNATDAALRDRATHTGTQLASTISDFATAVAATAAVTANTAKVTNATHTGDVTGADALTIAADAVTNAKMANMATATIKGRTTAGTGDPEDLTPAQVRTMLNVADGAQVNVPTDLAYTASTRLLASSTGADATLPLVTTGDAGLAPASGGGTTNFLRADGTWAAPPGGGGGVSDGDKGDITVSSGTTVWTIDAGVVTLAKMADMATDSFIGRDTAGTGTPEVLSAATARTILNVADGATANATDAALRDRATHTGTQAAGTITGLSALATGTDAANLTGTLAAAQLPAMTGAVTSSAGSAATSLGSFTKAQLDAAVSDGNVLYVGDVTTNATHTGDATGATALTLATVNSNVGSFGSATEVATFAVNAKGLTTAAGNVTISIPATAISDSTAAGRAVVTAASATAQTALFDLFTTSAKGLAPASGGGTTNFLRADGTWAAPAGGGGVSDGDKGDITVSASGATWTIDAGAVGTSKLGGDITTAGKELLDDADAPAQRTTLGLGTAATMTGPTGAIVGTTDTQTLTNKTLTDPAIIGTIIEDVFTITDGAAFEINPGNGSVQLITLGASRTPKATSFVAGEAITLMVDDGSAFALTWTDATFGGSGVVWETDAGVAPTLSTTGYTTIVLWKVGTQVYGARVGNA